MVDGYKRQFFHVHAHGYEIETVYDTIIILIVHLTHIIFSLFIRYHYSIVYAVIVILPIV